MRIQSYDFARKLPDVHVEMAKARNPETDFKSLGSRGLVMKLASRDGWDSHEP